MGLFRKHRLLFVLLLVIGIVFSTLFFTIFYQLKQVKEPVLTFLKSQINGDIQITEATVSLFPTGLRLKNVKLFAPEDKEPSATIEEVDIHFNLFQFFQKNIDTRIDVQKPSLQMRVSADGKSNFEKIFEPMILNSNKKNSGMIEKLWWKRLNVTRLVIHDANLISNGAKPEIEDLEIDAEGLDFNSTQNSSIKMSFHLPHTTRELIKLNLNLKLDPVEKTLQVKKGNLFWGSAEMELTGKMLLPNSQRKNTELALAFSMTSSDLRKFFKVFSKSSSLTGDLSLQGKITGSIFSPVIQLFLNAKKLNLSGKEISNLHAEVSKKGQVIEIQKATFEIYGGSSSLTGNLVPGKTTSGNFNVTFQGLRLASITGKPSPTSLDGHLNLKSSNLETSSFAGGGDIELGPIPLPSLNFKDKMKGAQLLTETIFGSPQINFDLLSNSANIIGTQIDQITSQITLAGNDTTLNSFHFSNSKISGSGSGVIQNQKSINASGTAVISSGVVAALFPDPSFRSSVTGGKGTLSIPFHVSGPLDNPSFTFDTSFLKNVIGKTIESTLKNLILSPSKIINRLTNPLLKNTPLKNLPLPANDQKGSNSPPEVLKHLFFGN